MVLKISICELYVLFKKVKLLVGNLRILFFAWKYLFWMGDWDFNVLILYQISFLFDQFNFNIIEYYNYSLIYFLCFVCFDNDKEFSK